MSPIYVARYMLFFQRRSKNDEVIAKFTEGSSTHHISDVSQISSYHTQLQQVERQISEHTAATGREANI